ncbi:MAG: phosphopantetheine-binding protein, partial [Cyanobacteria bacterium P01_D01_bin.50]
RQEAKGKRDNNILPHSLTPSLPHSTNVPIGTPIHNTQIYILDSHLRQVPIRVAGELYIGGDGLARGYLKIPDLTAERFIPNPFSSSPSAPSASSAPSTLYKTGDLARYLPDGNIEFLGRIDYQVKIRGFRIELGEIEGVLLQHPEVKNAVVIAKEYQSQNQNQNQNNNSRLVAYIVPNRDIDKTELQKSLRSFLEAKLPLYMVPSAFVIVESIPLTPNGKIDRRSLLALDEMGGKLTDYVQPRNPNEETIANIWKEVLKIERVGIYDNFFELGGNSLLATRINSRLRQTFELDLPLRIIFEKPTIAGISEHIQALQITIKSMKNPNTSENGHKHIEL